MAWRWVAVIGMPGAGKSTIATALARAIDGPVFHLDAAERNHRGFEETVRRRAGDAPVILVRSTADAADASRRAAESDG